MTHRRNLVREPIDPVVTSGTFSLDGGTCNVDNNGWIVDDADEAGPVPEERIARGH